MKSQRATFGSLRLWLVVMLATGTLISCYGRHEAADGDEIFEKAAFGLVEDRPLVVAFGALWCKPCRKEIHHLNQVVEQFGDNVDVLGLLVEGAVNGQAIVQEDVRRFRGIDGELPQYPLQIDPDWQVFERSKPRAAKSLPLLLLVDSQGKIIRKYQRSLDFESELKPLVEDLIAGSLERSTGDAAGNGGDPDDRNGPDGEKPKRLPWFAIDNWIATESLRETDQPYKLLYAGWEFGLANEGFTTDEMPFLTGSVQVSLENLPRQARWVSESLCECTVFFDEAGQPTSSFGICN